MQFNTWKRAAAVGAAAAARREETSHVEVEGGGNGGGGDVHTHEHGTQLAAIRATNAFGTDGEAGV